MQGLQPNSTPLSEKFTKYNRNNTVKLEYKYTYYLMKYKLLNCLKYIFNEHENARTIPILFSWIDSLLYRAVKKKKRNSWISWKFRKISVIDWAKFQLLSKSSWMIRDCSEIAIFNFKFFFSIFIDASVLFENH